MRIGMPLTRLGRAIAGFTGELKRRHVFRVALVYGAMGWVVIQVSNALLPALRLPDWSESLVAALLILSFPIALALAWAFDLTASGIQPADTPRRTADGPRPGPWPTSGTAGPAGPSTRGGRVEARSGSPPAAGRADGRRSIVALPFVDRSPEGGYQFLGDGITEELINGLARVDGLRVVSRTSAFAVRDVGADVREIGSRLGGTYVVEGSLRVSDDRLRITVQLVDVCDGFAAWSGTFDRKVEDLFILQEEIARSIVEALRAQWVVPGDGGALRPRDNAPLFRSSTTSLRAYTLYLRGRVHWNERTPSSLQAAIHYFQRAVAADAQFAHAHAGLADCYAILLDYGLISPAEGLAHARAAADRAVALAPELAESHTSSALLRQLEWQWSAAEKEFRAALALDPGHAPASHRLALLLAWTGRTEESRGEIDRARRLDPLSPVIAASRGWIEYYAGDHDAAIRILQEALELHPAAAAPRIPLALARLQAGQPAAAVADLKRALEVTGETGSTTALLAFALAHAGRPADARRLHDALVERARRRYTSPYYLAVVLLGLRRESDALTELERGVAERCAQLVYLPMEPLFAPLRGRPEFLRVLDRIGMPPAGH